jgi:inositol phosphorylceramide mannosyltransferase catalytic subunit
VENLGAKSDIFRLEILIKYGGIYADTDFECLRNFDQICRMTDFFAGLVYDKKPVLANGLIGSSVGNGILTSYVKDLGKMIRNMKSGKLTTEKIMNMTGPYKFTEKYLGWIKEHKSGSIPFPVTFFYCFPNNERYMRDDKQIVRSYIRNESYAIHYWSTSWVKNVGFLGKIYRVITRLISKFL